MKTIDVLAELIDQLDKGNPERLIALRARRTALLATKSLAARGSRREVQHDHAVN